jgi:hypothetical protein
VTGARREVTAGATERNDAHRQRICVRIFRQAEAPDTWTADAVYPADSLVPYTLTAKAETLLGEVGSPTTPLRKAHSCGMRTHPPQARSGLSGQPRTYITRDLRAAV